MRNWLLIALLAGSAAGCGDSPDGPSPDGGPGSGRIDADGDGRLASNDCDDHDASRWQNLAYQFVDADGDGYEVHQLGTLCTGATLPKGYLNSGFGKGEDCDDADAQRFAGVTGYVDVDGDGFGDGDAIVTCADGKLPPGQAAQLGDCAPDDAARWQLSS